MRIAAQGLLDLKRQGVHPFAHVGSSDCQPDPQYPSGEGRLPPRDLI
jgi:hypothetical protein